MLTAGRSLAELAHNHQIVVVHGNGPQVGMLALESAADRELERPYPLDVLVAETQGMIGYWLAGALHLLLPGRQVVALLTQTVVDASDRAFTSPTKFIGPTYSTATARHLATERHWQLRRDGRRWRRVVPSPRPTSIVEIESLRQLLDAGVIVIAGGGGGIPVTAKPGGPLRGIEAVVDKDHTAALLAVETGANALLILTDVDAVYRDFGAPNATAIRAASVADLVSLGLPDGSMKPKIEACAQFLRAGGQFAAIGALEDATEILAGHRGTRVRLHQ